MTSFFKRKTERLSLIGSLVILSLLVVGCAGPTYQGWSGFAPSDDVLYFGGIDGRVYAISTTARSQNLTFPSQGEWVFKIPSAAATGSICGPACAPASPQGSIYATPVVVGDLVCVGIYASDTGKLVAINRLAPGYTEGVPLRSKGEWVYPSLVKIGAIVGTPVVTGNTLYTGSSDGKLYAIDTAYGEKRWEFDTGGKIWTSPSVEDGVIYVSNYDRKLFAVSSTDGTLIWQTELSSSIASSPAVSGDSIYVGTFDNHLYAIDKTNGKERWSFEGGNWFWSTPVVKEGMVYAGCLDNKLYAVDTGSGKELWKFVADGPIVSEPTLTDSYVIVASKTGEVYVLNSSKGDLVKSIHVGFPIMAPLLVEGDTLYVHAGSLCVYGIDLVSGEKIWEFCYSSNE